MAAGSSGASPVSEERRRRPEWRPLAPIRAPRILRLHRARATPARLRFGARLLTLASRTPQVPGFITVPEQTHRRCRAVGSGNLRPVRSYSRRNFTRPAELLL